MFGRKTYTIVVDQSPDETVAFEHRERFESFPFRHEIRGLHVFFPGEDIVHLASDPVVWDLPISASNQSAAPKYSDDYF